MTIKARFENGVFQPLDPREVSCLRPGQAAEVQVRADPHEEAGAASQPREETGRALAAFFARIDALPPESTAPPADVGNGDVDAELYGDYLYRKKMGRDGEGPKP